MAVPADERAKDRSDLLTNRVTEARAIVRFSPENLEDLAGYIPVLPVTTPATWNRAL